MKRNLIIIPIMLMTIFISVVNAEELTYYTNSNNVNFSKEEYEFISNFYFEGYQNYMTEEDYKEFKKSNIMNADIKTQVLEYSDINPLSGLYETQMKQSKVSSACSTNCTVATTLLWKQNPTVRSYDLIGAYFNNTSLVSSQNTYLMYGSKKVNPTETTEKSTGMSATIKLPSTKETMAITQIYTVKKSGSINVSYQHARKSISLANSRKYSFASSGYGGVFDFNESISSYYDAMGGLKVTF